MPNELDLNTTWTFYAECAVPKEVTEMLVAGEVPHAAFRTIRDVAIFTNLRLIVRDSQGLTGKKVEQYSLPWSSVNAWSSENAGHLDFDSEIELWTRAGHVKLSLKRGADVRRIDNLIAAHVLGGPMPTAPAYVNPQQTAQVAAAPAPTPYPTASAPANTAPAPAAKPSAAEALGGMLGGRNPFKR